MRTIHALPVLLSAAVVAQAPAVISPLAAASGTGSANWYPFGAGQMAYQQVHSAWSFTSNSPRTVQALRVRPRSTGTTVTIDVELHMGRAPHGALQADPVFANNIVPGSEINVFTRKNVALPSVASAGWHVTLPFDNPFPWSGGDLEWRAIVHGNDNNNQPSYYPMDSWTARGDSRQTGSFAGCASALGAAPAEQRCYVLSPGLVSHFEGFSHVAAGGLPSALNIGFSATSIGGLPLPVDLGAIGAPGCAVVNDIQTSITGTTNANPEGSVDYFVPLPADARLVGATFYTQVVFLQPGANALGAFLTRGATNVVGQNHGLSRIAGGYGRSRGVLDLQWGLAIGLD